MNIAVTLAKATSEPERDSDIGLLDVCDHTSEIGKSYRITRYERCERCQGAPKNKTKGVVVDEGKIRILSNEEQAEIENFTKLTALTVDDAQPLKNLPVMYGTATYYIRHDEKSKASPLAFSTLVASLSRMNYGLVCKWSPRTTEKLCVIHAVSGVLILQVCPFLSEIRVASKKERAHFQAKPEKKHVDGMCELLIETGKERFDYASYQDEGRALRSKVAASIIKGEKPKPRKAPPQSKINDNDIMQAINNAIRDMKDKETQNV